MFLYHKGQSVNDKPILFSTDMVKALLDGRKTQTRRVIKPQPEWDNGAFCVPGYFSNTEKGFAEDLLRSSFPCYYGQPGDLLWVRETWKAYDRRSLLPKIFYRATEPESWPHLKWRPSIHMFRWTSRLTLKIKDIRVERVQDISFEDTQDEGIFLPGGVGLLHGPVIEALTIADFSALWDSINLKLGYGWDSNPFVWVINFTVIKENIDVVLDRLNSGM